MCQLAISKLHLAKEWDDLSHCETLFQIDKTSNALQLWHLTALAYKLHK